MITANIPQNTKDTLDRYVNHRIPTGGFLQSVLANDLAGAVARADSYNRAALADIVQYIYNELPIACWGSQEVVEQWLAGE